GAARAPRGAGRAPHPPVACARKRLFIQCLGELLIIPQVVLPTDPLLRHPGRAARLEDVERLPLIRTGDPPLVRLVPQPLVLEVREPDQVGAASDLLRRIPTRPLRPVEPARRSGLRREMPLYDRAQMGIPCFGGSPDVGVGWHGVTFGDAGGHTGAGSAAARVDGKYLSIVFELGGRVSRETNIMQRADPTTIGKTVINPR